MSLKQQNTILSHPSSYKSKKKKIKRSGYKVSIKKPIKFTSIPSFGSLHKIVKIKNKSIRRSKKKKGKSSRLLKSSFHKMNQLIEFNRKTMVFTNIQTIILSGMNETNYHLLSNILVAVEKLNSNYGDVKLKDVYDKNSQFLFYYACSILYNNRYLDVLCTICSVDRKTVEMKIEDFLGIKKMNKFIKGGGIKISRAINFIWNIMNIILIVSFSIGFFKTSQEIAKIYEYSETKQILSPLVQQIEKSLHDPSYLKKCIIKKRVDQTSTNIEYKALKLLLEPFGIPFSNMINDFTAFQQCIYNDFSIINQEDMNSIAKKHPPRAVRDSITMGDNIINNLDEDIIYSNTNQMMKVDENMETAMTTNAYDNFATNMGDFSGKMLSDDFKNSIDSIFDNEGTDFDKLTKFENFITKYIEYGDDYETALIDIFGQNYQEGFDLEFCNKVNADDYTGYAYCRLKKSSMIGSVIIQSYNLWNTGRFAALWLNIRVYFNDLNARFQHYKIHFKNKQSKIFMELKYFKDEITRLISLMYCVFWASLSVATYCITNYYWYIEQRRKTLKDGSVVSTSGKVGSVKKTVSLKPATFDLDKLVEDDLLERFSKLKMDDVPSINSID